MGSFPMSSHILLIEDEDDIREVAQASLELTRGWTVHTASSGRAGIEAWWLRRSS